MTDTKAVVRMTSILPADVDARLRMLAKRSGVSKSNMLAALVAGIDDDKFDAFAQAGNVKIAKKRVDYRELRTKLMSMNPDKLAQVLELVENS